MKSAVSEDGPLLLTSREAAQRLRISERSLWQLAKDGRLPVVRLGRSVRYSISDLQALISRSTQHGLDVDAGA